jgi:hypothetical protein
MILKIHRERGQVRLPDLETATLTFAIDLESPAICKTYLKSEKLRVRKGGLPPHLLID